MNIPNVITLVRLVSVPVIIWLILQNRMDYAFGLFMLAGISDAIDGPLARHFGFPPGPKGPKTGERGTRR